MNLISLETAFFGTAFNAQRPITELRNAADKERRERLPILDVVVEHAASKSSDWNAPDGSSAGHPFGPVIGARSTRLQMRARSQPYLRLPRRGAPGCLRTKLPVSCLSGASVLAPQAQEATREVIRSMNKVPIRPNDPIRVPPSSCGRARSRATHESHLLIVIAWHLECSYPSRIIVPNRRNPDWPSDRQALALALALGRVGPTRYHLRSIRAIGHYACVGGVVSPSPARDDRPTVTGQQPIRQCPAHGAQSENRLIVSQREDTFAPPRD